MCKDSDNCGIIAIFAPSFIILYQITIINQTYKASNYYHSNKFGSPK